MAKQEWSCEMCQQRRSLGEKLSSAPALAVLAVERYLPEDRLLCLLLSRSESNPEMLYNLFESQHYLRTHDASVRIAHLLQCESNHAQSDFVLTPTQSWIEIKVGLLRRSA